ncbi:MAG: EamA family transporter [Gammaproteobacteria bacterium]|nr:EamA family transporter [Gammaproteobacteria bacterium]
MSNTLLYIITVLIWGSTWLAIEFQLGVVEPEVSIVYRYAIASALLFAWSSIRGLRLKFDLRSHAWFVLLGFFLFCLNYILTYRAQVHITSALCAIVFTAMVWINILLSRIFFNVRAGRRVLGGAALGILGIVVLFAPQIDEVSLTDSVFYGSVLAALGAFVASFGNMASQKAQLLKLPVIQSNAWGMFYGACLTAIYTIIAGYRFTFEYSPDYIVSLAYLSIFGSIIAFGAYLTLLGRIGAHKAGYAMVMFPVVALILSMLFEGLHMDASIIVGTTFVLAGNVFVLKGATPTKPPNPVGVRVDSDS